MACVESFKTAFDESLHAESFAAEAPGGAVNADLPFIRSVIDALKSLAITAIDTPEEREQILAYVMAAADMFLAVKIPAYRFVRPFLESMVRNLIENLADL